MAILTKPVEKSIYQLNQGAPNGSWIATNIAIQDRYKVERKKFNSDEMETVDLTAFLFEFKDKAGKSWQIGTKDMRISGHPESALFKFLTTWLGQAPRYNWDYAEMKGKQGLITVTHTPSRSNPAVIYSQIASVIPVPDGIATTSAQSTVGERSTDRA